MFLLSFILTIFLLRIGVRGKQSLVVAGVEVSISLMFLQSRASSVVSRCPVSNGIVVSVIRHLQLSSIFCVVMIFLLNIFIIMQFVTLVNRARVISCLFLFPLVQHLNLFKSYIQMCGALPKFLLVVINTMSALLMLLVVLLGFIFSNINLKFSKSFFSFSDM